MKHLISIDDMSDIDSFLLSVKDIKTIPKLYQFDLQNKILTNLFYEPSTRTSSSFHSAMTRLGGKVLSINEITYSSVSKGENLQDTLRTIGYQSDIIVLRTQNAGDAGLAAEVSSVPIINAGDGNGEHPTQTLLDLYTIYENLGRSGNFRITFIGDIENSRTVHSLAKVLEKNCRVEYLDTYNFDTLPLSDVYYLTRVQRERGSTGSYQLTESNIRKMPGDSIVMHPFPRNEEIPSWFDSDPRAKYFEQIKNGLYVRMALLRSYRDCP